MVRTKPDDDYDRKLLADIEQHGWHLVGIPDEPNGPAYVFSVGIYHTLGHPEICIFGLSDTNTMGQIVNLIGDEVKAGKQFEDWHESDDILDGYSCIFRNVDKSLYRENFGYGLWYYEGPDFPMLQCVWPDKSQRFPWESDFDAQMIESQPVLAKKRAWLFDEAKNRGVFTTHRVLEEGYPILMITHDHDGDWQFLCGTTNATEDARVVSLANIAESHPSILEIADLPMGWRAERDDPNSPWRRMKND